MKTKTNKLGCKVPDYSLCRGRVPDEYIRKLVVATEIAMDAWTVGGLDAMEQELAKLRRQDADSIIIAELDRIYHAQIKAVAGAGQRYW